MIFKYLFRYGLKGEFRKIGSPILIILKNQWELNLKNIVTTRF